MENENKVIMVTGAGGGMGSEVVKKLLQDKATVIALDLSLQGLEGVQSDNLIKTEVNLKNENSIKEVFQTTYNDWEKIDGLINIAGIPQSSTPIEEVSLKEWENIMAINATGVFLT